MTNEACQSSQGRRSWLASGLTPIMWKHLVLPIPELIYTQGNEESILTHLVNTLARCISGRICGTMWPKKLHGQCSPTHENRREPEAKQSQEHAKLPG